MSDQRLIDAIRDEIVAVPVRSGDLDAVIRRGGKRRLAYRLGVSSAAITLCLLVLGSALLVGTRPAPVAVGESLELIRGFAVPVFSEPSESGGALVYLAQPGPILSDIDTRQLGTEIAITPGRPNAFVVPANNALRTDRIVYLGDLGGAQLALHSFGGELMLYLGNGTEVAGSGTAATEEGLAGGVSVDPPVGHWLAWTGLPEAAAVVVGETEDGTRYWQRVIGRTAVFIVAGDETLNPTTLSALDATGTEVATTRGLDLDLNQIGFPAASEDAIDLAVEPAPGNSSPETPPHSGSPDFGP